ncbi:hypothetical protein [Flindersiella endophytica]
MPQLLTVRVMRPGRRPLRIWLPVLPILLLLSPVVVLAVVGVIVACHIYRVDVTRALGIGWSIVSALPGTRVDFAEGRTSYLVTIR